MKSFLSALNGTKSSSNGDQLEKTNSITSIESGAMTPSHHSENEGGTPTVAPHMGLISSCNMVRNASC